MSIITAYREMPETKANNAFLAPSISPLEEVNISDFHCSYGYIREALLYDTTKQLGAKLRGELQPCAGYSMGKRLREAIPSTASSRSLQKLQRVFGDVNGKKSRRVNWWQLRRHNRSFTRSSWVHLLKSAVSKKFKYFLGDVEAVRSDNGGKFIRQSLVDVCNHYRIGRELMAPRSLQYNWVAEGGLGIIQNTARSARIHVPFLFHNASVT